MNTLTILSESQTDPNTEHQISMISAFAHELKNPLATINLSVKMLESLQDEKLKLYLDIIMRSSVHITELINEQVEYRPIREIKNKKESIQKLLDEVLDMARDKIKLKNILVIKDYCSIDFAIAVDKTKMKIALNNIIINALEAMNSESGKLKINTYATANKYIVRIQDNGCGISTENIENIFKKYFTTKPDGHGIGLLTVHNFLLVNNIKVNVESEEGVGTSFILAFAKRF